MPPWEKYQDAQTTAGPWQKYGAAEPEAAPEPSTLGDVATQTGVGAVKGLGGIGDIGGGESGGLIGQGTRWVLRELGLNVPPEEQAAAAQAKALGGMPNIAAPDSGQTTRAAEAVTGAPLPEAQTTPGKYAQTAASFVTNPTSYLGPGGAAAKVGTAITGGLGSELGGQLTADTPIGRIIGAMLGATAPAAAARAVSPLHPSPQRMNNINTLRAEGIEPTAGDFSGSKTIRTAESALGDAPMAGGAYSRAQEEIARNLTRTALARAGSNADNALPATLNVESARVGGQFDQLAARNYMQPDPLFGQQTQASIRQYNDLVSPPNRSPLIANFEQEIAQATAANNGTLPGAAYQSLRSRLEQTADGAPAAESRALRGLKNALDAGMERTIARTNPADLGAWRQAREQYRDLLVIKRAMSGAGEQTVSEGLLTPAKLRQAQIAIEGENSYVLGRGRFSDLTHAAGILRPAPSSYTSERGFMLQTVPHIGAAGIGAALGTPLGLTLPGLVAGAAAPGLVGRHVVMNPYVQAYLKNQYGRGLQNAIGPASRAATRSIAPATGSYYQGTD